MDHPELVQQLRGMLQRAVVGAVDDTGDVQTVDYTTGDDVARTLAEVHQAYGVSSLPPDDQPLTLVMGVGGDQGHAVALHLWSAYRFGKLGKGEVAVYDWGGNRLHLKAGGNVDLLAAALLHQACQTMTANAQQSMAHTAGTTMSTQAGTSMDMTAGTTLTAAATTDMQLTAGETMGLAAALGMTITGKTGLSLSSEGSLGAAAATTMALYAGTAAALTAGEDASLTAGTTVLIAGPGGITLDGDLVVTGDATFSKNVTIAGNLTVGGTITGTGATRGAL